MKIIIYDSNCKFCTRFSQWCVEKNTDFKILSVREKPAKTLLREKGIKFIDLQTIYFLDNNQYFVRSKAIFRILSYFRFPWKSISFLSFLPTFLTDFGYKIFAKYRYYI